MMKLMKRALLVMMILVLSLYGSLPVLADGQRVFDDAGLFDEGQKTKLEEQTGAFIKKTGIDAAIVTAVDTQGKTSQQYADDFADEQHIGKGQNLNGIVFLIDMFNREIAISTSGIMIDIMTDDRIESALDEIYAFMPDGQYENAALTFLKEIEKWTDKGIEEGQYRYDSETGEISQSPESAEAQKSGKKDWGLALGSGVIWGLAAGIGTFFGVKRSYKGKKKRFDQNFCKDSQLTLKDKDDCLVDQRLRTRIIPKNPPSNSSSGGSSSGRSTTHTSSSGRTHGGGSRKF